MPMSMGIQLAIVTPLVCITTIFFPFGAEPSGVAQTTPQMTQALIPYLRTALGIKCMFVEVTYIVSTTPRKTSRIGLKTVAIGNQECQ